MRPLPIGGFRFLSVDETSALTERLCAIPLDGSKGYILTVNLSYPKHLHQLHGDYPLAPEHVVITKPMLSPMQRAMLEELVVDERERMAIDTEEPVTPHRLTTLKLTGGALFFKSIKVHSLLITASTSVLS